MPHYFWLYWWTIAFVFIWLGNWIFTLLLGRSPQSLHDFLLCHLRYTVHLLAYLGLTANPYPGFLGIREYPIDVTVEHARQRRLITLFRPVLAIPALILSWVFLVVFLVIGFAGWFVSLALGRMPKGMRDLSAYCLRYDMQTRAYITFLADRYPSLGAPPG